MKSLARDIEVVGRESKARGLIPAVGGGMIRNSDLDVNRPTPVRIPGDEGKLRVSGTDLFDEKGRNTLSAEVTPAPSSRTVGTLFLA